MAMKRRRKEGMPEVCGYGIDSTHAQELKDREEKRTPSLWAETLLLQDGGNINQDRASRRKIMSSFARKAHSVLKSLYLVLKDWVDEF